jgi:hypothetical protein
VQSWLIGVAALVPLVLVGPTYGQTSVASPSTPMSLDAPLPAPVLPPPGYEYPPADPPASPQVPLASPKEAPFPAPALSTAPPSWHGPTGWFRLAASFGFCPFAGNMKYDLVYRGGLIDTFSGPVEQSPSVSISAEAQPVRFLFLGLSVQYISNVKWAQGQPTYAGSFYYGGSGYELDFLPRLGLTLPLTSRVRLLASGAPGYSIIEASDLAKGPFANPRSLKGFVVQGDTRVIVLLTHHAFVQADVSGQWGFQNSTVTSKTSDQTATAKLRSAFLGLQVGVGYWF